MAEYVRSIEAEIRVDTNKQTTTYALTADSITDLERQFRELVAELRR